MKEHHKFNFELPSSARAGILIGVALAAALIIMALFVPRFLTKSPYQDLLQPGTVGLLRH